MNNGALRMSPGLKRSLTAQSAENLGENVASAAQNQQKVQKSRKVLGKSSDLPPSTPENQFEEVQKLSSQLKRAKMVKFLDSHRRLMSELTKRPLDVRIIVHITNWFGHLLVKLVHLYANSREFVTAHQHGFCSKVIQAARLEKCASCNWSYEYREAKYCRGCNCPAWPASRLSHKVKLAGFACPVGKFGKARGWTKRLCREVFLLKPCFETPEGKCK